MNDEEKLKLEASPVYCRNCGAFNIDAVKDTRVTSSFALRRRRRCTVCDARWSTLEQREVGIAPEAKLVFGKALLLYDEMGRVLREVAAAVVELDVVPTKKGEE